MRQYEHENDTDYRPANPAGSVEPIRKPDHKAKKHSRPSVVRKFWPIVTLALGVTNADAAVVRPHSPAAAIVATRALVFEQICYGVDDAELPAGMTIEALIEADALMTEMLHEISGEENDYCGMMAIVERR